MERYILFRSKKIRTRTAWDNILTHRGRGTDFADIVPYSVGDDTRDISWTHSGRTDTLMRKVRAEEDSFPILVINTIDESHGFFTDIHQKSPYQFAMELTESIQTSAQKYHFPSQIQTDTSWLKEKKNHMILYISTTLDSTEIASLAWLTHDNDVILIHVFHPYEVDPSTDLIFTWLSLSNKRYQEEFEKKKNDIQETILKSGGAYLSMTTDVKSTPCMNNFFKNRFGRKS